MSINLKAKETLVQIGEMKGQYRYLLSTELYNKLTESKIIKEAALRSGISRGVIQACWDATGEVIKTWTTEGHSVAIPGLGTMRFGVRAKSVANVSEVASGGSDNPSGRDNNPGGGGSSPGDGDIEME